LELELELQLQLELELELELESPTRAKRVALCRTVPYHANNGIHTKGASHRNHQMKRKLKKNMEKEERLNENCR